MKTEEIIEEVGIAKCRTQMKELNVMSNYLSEVGELFSEVAKLTADSINGFDLDKSLLESSERIVRCCKSIKHYATPYPRESSEEEFKLPTMLTDSAAERAFIIYLMAMDLIKLEDPSYHAVAFRINVIEAIVTEVKMKECLKVGVK